MNQEDYDEIMEAVRGEIGRAIDDLALMMQREFASIHETLDEFRGEFGKIRTEMREMKQELRTEMHDMREEMKAEMQDMKAEMQDMKAEMQDIRQEMHAGFAAVNGMVVNHEIRIERVEKKTGSS